MKQVIQPLRDNEPQLPLSHNDGGQLLGRGCPDGGQGRIGRQDSSSPSGGNSSTLLENRASEDRGVIAIPPLINGNRVSILDFRRLLGHEDLGILLQLIRQFLA